VSEEPWQILADCAFCRVEASVVEIVDPLHPACHFGLAADSRCRACGWQAIARAEDFAPRMPISSGRCPACNQPVPEGPRTGGGPCPHCGYAPTLETVSEPEDLRDEATARAALQRWAEAEGEPDVAAFAAANLGGDLESVLAHLAAGEPVSTTFDVIAFLFPQLGGAAGTGGRAVPTEAIRRVVDRPPQVYELAATEVVRPPVDGRRAATRVLVSVMVADGELRAGERQFVDAFVAREHLPPFRPDDLRVWRPDEIGPIDADLRDKVLEAAVALAHLDRMRDGSEWKVIAAYAKAWGVGAARLKALDDRYDAEYGTIMTRLYRLLSSLVRF
jgi:hypothetical protein